MFIKLTNGVELNPLVVTGGIRTVLGANRETLTFVFPAETSMDELDAIFTPENCESIIIVEGGTEYIHSGYAIRAELKRVPVMVTSATDSEAEVVEDRVMVSMSQRTYV